MLYIIYDLYILYYILAVVVTFNLVINIILIPKPYLMKLLYVYQ